MTNPLKNIPSVDRILSNEIIDDTATRFGRQRTTEFIRSVLSGIRTRVLADNAFEIPADSTIIGQVQRELQASAVISPRKVYNLTGTILHTNLGRAFLPASAISAVSAVASGASNLEFDIDTGSRGDRDSHLESLLTELTGAEAATVVNNNAAAVLLCLNTLAMGKGVCVSRGELVEIGGSFRIPEVMIKSGCHLIEVGATNRTHIEDYERAITGDTALLMKVHTSNYEIKGFTSAVSYGDVSGIAKKHGLPFLADLGSGTLIRLEDLGLPHEPTVSEVLESGADLVTFSGDKLLGGPQAGIIAGSQALIEQVKQNPLKRALRVDKMTIAALAEVLKLYRDPETLKETLPTIGFLSRTYVEVDLIAEQLLDKFNAAIAGVATACKKDTFSQIGSGALPLDTLPSVAIEITPDKPGEGELQRITQAFRQLAVPFIGRLQDGKLLFDLRTVTSVEDIEHHLATLGLK